MPARVSPSFAALQDRCAALRAGDPPPCDGRSGFVRADRNHKAGNDAGLTEKETHMPNTKKNEAAEKTRRKREPSITSPSNAATAIAKGTGSRRTATTRTIFCLSPKRLTWPTRKSSRHATAAARNDRPRGGTKSTSRLQVLRKSKQNCDNNGHRRSGCWRSSSR